MNIIREICQEGVPVVTATNLLGLRVLSDRLGPGQEH